MVRRHIVQMIRTRNFRARKERIETGVLVKNHKGKNASVKRRVGECHQWKANGSVQEETLAVFATEVIVDTEDNRPLLFRRRKHRLTEKNPRKALAPREKALLEGKVGKRAKISSKMMCVSATLLESFTLKFCVT